MKYYKFLIVSLIFLVSLFIFSPAYAQQSPPGVEIISPQNGQELEPGEEVPFTIDAGSFLFVDYKNNSVPFPGNDNAGHAHLWIVPATIDTNSLNHDNAYKLLGVWFINIVAPSAGDINNMFLLRSAESGRNFAGIPAEYSETGDYKIVIELAQNHHVTYDPPVRDEVLIHIREPFNTPAGFDVEVESNGVSFTFSQVTQSGNTEVEISDTGTEPQSGFQLGDPATYYNITTTAQFTGTVEICVNYEEGQFGMEENLKFMHYENGEWVDITTLLDTQNNIICGETDSFSEFALMTQNSIEELLINVRELGLSRGIENSLLKKLQNAGRMFERGYTKPGVNLLNAFIKEVNALSGKKLTLQQADNLIKYTEGLISLNSI